MPSPFPGMDPYLEDPDIWGGVHHGFIYTIHAELNRVLPAGFVAHIDQYVWVREEPDDRPTRRVKPDVFAVPGAERKTSGPAVKTVTQPTTRGRLPRARRRRNRRVTITAARGRQLLTAIEVLSPSNKRHGEDHDAYLQKRREYLGSVNLIEIDLLRTGGRMDSGTPIPPPSDYLVVACLAEGYPAVETWAFDVRDPLPVIPVAVGHPDDPTPLDLRACFDRLYDDGMYASSIDYGQPPVVPLRMRDVEWAADLLKRHARRKR